MWNYTLSRDKLTLENRNNWSLVEWKNKEEELEIKGWVCNDFLQKIQIKDYIE